MYPQIYNEYWTMPAGVAPPATPTFVPKLWATVYMDYTGKSHNIFRCPFDPKLKNADQGDLTFRFGPEVASNIPESQRRVSYLYMGLEIWKAGSTVVRTADGMRFTRKIYDPQSYQSSLYGDVGWLARDKNFTIGGRLGTAHSISPNPIGAANQQGLEGVKSNVLLLDSSVKARGRWDG